MKPSEYLTVATFGNDTDKDVTLYLEMLGEEVVISPGHRIDLLAKPSPDLLPIAVHQVAEGMQVFPKSGVRPELACEVQWQDHQGGASVAPV